MAWASMRKWWSGEKEDEKDLEDPKGDSGDPFMQDATNAAAMNNAATPAKSQQTAGGGDIVVSPPQDDQEASVADEAPAGRRRWFPSFTWGKKKEEQVGDQAPLNLLLKVQGKGELVKVLNGRWKTSKGTLVMIDKLEVTFAGGKPRSLEVDGGEVSLSDCTINLPKSNHKNLVWSDGDIWTRYSESDDSTRAQDWADRTTTPLSAIPLAIKVTCYEQPEIEGEYLLMEDINNGMPAWQSKRQRLYNGPGGYWMFASAMKMQKNLGVVSSTHPHEGTFPDLIKSWDYYSGQPGEKDGWSKCSLMSVARVDDDGIVSRSARKPMNGVVRKSSITLPLSEEGMHFRIEVFFNELDTYQPQHVVHDLVSRVTTGKATIDRVLAALCKKFGQPEGEWQGQQCVGTVRYVLEQMYEQYDERHLSKVPNLLDDISEGKFTFDTVVQKLCERWKTRGAVYDDWIGDYPAALREGYDAAVRKLRKKSEAPGPDSGEEVLIQKGPSDPLKMDWKDHNLLTGVQEGGVGAKNGLERFIGYRLIYVNGKVVTKWKELVAAVNGQSSLKMTFYKKAVTENRPMLRRPTAVNMSRQSSVTPRKPQKRVSRVSSFTLPAATEGGLCVDRLTAVQYGEAAERSGIVDDETRCRVNKLLPGRAAMTVGVLAHNHKEWSKLRSDLRETSLVGQPPSVEITAKFEKTVAALRHSVAGAQQASRVCTIPPAFHKMIEATSMAVAKYQDLHSDVLSLKDEQSALKKDIDRLSAKVKENVEKAVEDPENEGLKGKVEALNKQLIEKENDRAVVIDSYLNMCAEDPLMAWVPVAEKEREEKRKKKKDKKDKKKSKSRVPTPPPVELTPHEDGDMIVDSASDDEPSPQIITHTDARAPSEEPCGDMVPCSDDDKDDCDMRETPPPVIVDAKDEDEGMMAPCSGEDPVVPEEEPKKEKKEKKDKKSKKEKKARKAAKRAREQAEKEAAEKEAKPEEGTMEPEEGAMEPEEGVMEPADDSDGSLPP